MLHPCVSYPEGSTLDNVSPSQWWRLNGLFNPDLIQPENLLPWSLGNRSHLQVLRCALGWKGCLRSPCCPHGSRNPGGAQGLNSCEHIRSQITGPQGHGQQNQRQVTAQALVTTEGKSTSMLATWIFSVVWWTILVAQGLILGKFIKEIDKIILCKRKRKLC